MPGNNFCSRKAMPRLPFCWNAGVLWPCEYNYFVPHNLGWQASLSQFLFNVTRISWKRSMQWLRESAWRCAWKCHNFRSLLVLWKSGIGGKNLANPWFDETLILHYVNLHRVSWHDAAWKTIAQGLTWTDNSTQQPQRESYLHLGSLSLAKPWIA